MVNGVDIKANNQADLVALGSRQVESFGGYSQEEGPSSEVRFVKYNSESGVKLSASEGGLWSFVIMKGKYAPGLPGPGKCDRVCTSELCPQETFDITYAYLPAARRQRGSRGVLMGYQQGFFAGWDGSAYFLVFMQLAAFWMSAIMVKHLSAVYKNVGQGASTL